MFANMKREYFLFACSNSLSIKRNDTVFIFDFRPIRVQNVKMHNVRKALQKTACWTKKLLFKFKFKIEIQRLQKKFAFTKEFRLYFPI